MSTDAGIVVIGAGQAGGALVAALRQGGFEGALTLIGAEPYPPYERPPLSKAALVEGLEPERLYLKRLDWYADKSVALRLGISATAIDRAAKRVRLASGDELRYATLVLATGGRARMPGFVDPRLPGIFVLRGIDDAAALRAALREGARVVVIGGGYIGLEAAAAANKLGAAVTVLERAPRLLARVASPPISAFFQDLHARHGVSIHTGVEPVAVEGSDRVTGVRLASGAHFAADLAIIGIGLLAETDLASSCGVAVDDGIVTDADGRTSDPSIFAIGDVARQHHAFLRRAVRLESVENAATMARRVAAAILGKPAPAPEIPWFWSHQFEAKLQSVGVPGPDARLVLRGDPASGSFSVLQIEAERLTGAETVNRLPDFVAAKRLIAKGDPVDPAALADAGRPLGA